MKSQHGYTLNAQIMGIFKELRYGKATYGYAGDFGNGFHFLDTANGYFWDPESAGHVSPFLARPCALHCTALHDNNDVNAIITSARGL